MMIALRGSLVPFLNASRRVLVSHSLALRRWRRHGAIGRPRIGSVYLLVRSPRSTTLSWLKCSDLSIVLSVL